MLSTRKEKQNIKSIKEWDPDFTKATPEERKVIYEAEQFRIVKLIGIKQKI